MRETGETIERNERDSRDGRDNRDTRDRRDRREMREAWETGEPFKRKRQKGQERHSREMKEKRDKRQRGKSRRPRPSSTWPLFKPRCQLFVKGSFCNSYDVFLFGLVSLTLSSGHTQDWILSSAHPVTLVSSIIYCLLPLGLQRRGS